MRRLTIAAAAMIGVGAVTLLFPNQVLNATVLLGNQASVRQLARKAQPITRAAVCYGVGWRGYGYYPSLLGLRPSCWDTLPNGGPVYPAPVHDPSAATYYYCDDPKGYFPDVQTCSTAWRAVR